MEKEQRQEPFVNEELDEGKKPVTALVPLSESQMDQEEKETWTELVANTLMGQDFLRRNWGMVALLIFLALIYVSNRYMADQEKILISDLQRELEEVRYRALTHSSELTMRCRLSYIEEALRHAGDSTLAAATEPPYIINSNPNAK